jgi:DNA-binding PadR family transcriptional regulator
MGKALTKAQAALLQDMVDCGAKSGNFWLDLGNPIQSLTALEHRGLVSVVEFRGSPSRSSYRITPAGRAVLEAQP